MASLSYNTDSKIIQAFTLHLDELLNNENPNLKACWVEFIYLNYSLIKLVRLIPKPHFWDLHLSIST